MLQAVLFDLDETLLDRSAGLEAFLHDQYARYAANFQHIPYATFRRRFVELDQHGYVHKSIVYQQLLDELMIQHVTVEELLTDYRMRCWQHGQTFADTHTTIATLRNWNLKLGIVTNGETAFQYQHMQATGLTALVDTLLISEQEQLRKPDPEIFGRAAARLDVSPGDCLFVGDNPTADILGAHGVGMQTAWLRHHRQWPAQLTTQPTYTIAMLRELLEIVKRDTSLAE